MYTFNSRKKADIQLTVSEHDSMYEDSLSQAVAMVLNPWNQTYQSSVEVHLNILQTLSCQSFIWQELQASQC